ncbi:renin receptor [Anaeramoeba ignava]|uniref:Renin receptor n=1 Tax=Anaeramoeba ignava TaxID=1746090 RepID=A0A9Q0LNL4_ANAIG|nr:renin receptor [Anaeramoeba ignava]
MKELKQTFLLILILILIIISTSKQDSTTEEKEKRKKEKEEIPNHLWRSLYTKRTGDALLEHITDLLDSSMIVIKKGIGKPRTINTTIHQATNQIANWIGLFPISDEDEEKEKANLLITIPSFGKGYLKNHKELEFINKIMNENVILDFQTRDKKIFSQDAASVLTTFLTGKYPKDHGIMSGFWARNDPPLNANLQELLQQVYKNLSTIVSVSSLKEYAKISSIRQEIINNVETKSFISFYEHKDKKMKGFLDLELKNIISQLKDHLFADFIKDGGLVFHNYNDNQLVIKNDKLDINVVYDLNVEEQAQFVAELILLNQLLVFNPIRDAQEIKYPDFWTISFGSLLYFERRTPIFNNSTKLMDYSIQFLIDHFNKVYNSKTAIEILITGSEVPSYKNKKSIGKIIFDMFGAHLRTDLQKTQELLPVIYLKEDRLKFKQEGCHKIRDFLKKHHFGFEVHCFVDHEEFLEQETHPLLLSKHKPIKKDSNDPNEKNQVHDIEENSFDISTFSFTVLLIILSFITIGVFCGTKMIQQKIVTEPKEKEQ